MTFLFGFPFKNCYLGISKPLSWEFPCLWCLQFLSFSHIIITRFWASKLRVRRRQRVSMCFPGMKVWSKLIAVLKCKCFSYSQSVEADVSPGRGHHSPGSRRAACAAAERSQRGSPGLARRSAHLAAGQLRDPSGLWLEIYHGSLPWKFQSDKWW